MSSPISFSLEYFPPRTAAGVAKLHDTCSRFAAFGPEYFSVTYGAGGSTHGRTRDLVLEINASGHPVAPHLSLGADDEGQAAELLLTYASAGITRIVALRGDLPSGMGLQRLVYANELVEFIRNRFGDHFRIAVACYPEVHPQASTYVEDVGYLKQKLDAGADYAVTQYFYNVDAFTRFMDECARVGIDKPIIPGIMPITNLEKLVRFSETCGTEIPRWLRKSLGQHQEGSEDLLKVGEEMVTRLCEKLIAQGVEVLHFYTLNQFEPTAALCRNLGLADAAAQDVHLHCSTDSG